MTLGSKYGEGRCSNFRAVLSDFPTKKQATFLGKLLAEGGYDNSYQAIWEIVYRYGYNGAVGRLKKDIARKKLRRG